MLRLAPDVHAQMLAHAIAGLPHEACGLFSGPPGTSDVTTFHPMANVAASSQIYRLDGAEMMAVERRADDDGLQILGVMHSHTHTTAYPSPTDVEDAGRFDPFGGFHYVIVSLRHPEAVLRSYRIVEGRITEERVSVEPLDAGAAR